MADSYQIALFVLQKISCTLSAIGSLMIISQITRSAFNRSKPQQRSQRPLQTRHDKSQLVFHRQDASAKEQRQRSERGTRDQRTRTRRENSNSSTKETENLICQILQKIVHFRISLISLKVPPRREFQGAQGRARRKARRTRGP